MNPKNKAALDKMIDIVLAYKPKKKAKKKATAKRKKP